MKAGFFLLLVLLSSLSFARNNREGLELYDAYTDLTHYAYALYDGDVEGEFVMFFTVFSGIDCAIEHYDNIPIRINSNGNLAIDRRYVDKFHSELDYLEFQKDRILYKTFDQSKIKEVNIGYVSGVRGDWTWSKKTLTPNGCH